jgi:competence protein ComEA
MRRIVMVLLLLGLATASGLCHEPSPAPTGAAAAPTVPTPVDLNAANAEQLDPLPGIGPALAARIVVYRDEHGPFTEVEQLNKVKGIGARTLEKLRPLLVLQ